MDDRKIPVELLDENEIAFTVDLPTIRDRLGGDREGFYAPYRPLSDSLGDERGIAALAAFWDFDFADESLVPMRCLRQPVRRPGRLERAVGRAGYSFRGDDSGGEPRPACRCGESVRANRRLLLREFAGPEGHAGKVIPIAVNDPAGRWEIRVRDVLTGQSKLGIRGLLICFAGSPSGVVGPALAADTAPGLRTVIEQVRGAYRSADAMRVMRDVYASDRYFTFPRFHATAEYLKKKMQEAGLSSVELVETPADGVTQVGYWTMPMAWDVKSARLEILDDSVPAASRVLADYEKVPSSLGMWSGPTAPGGVTAEVVEVKKSDVRNLGKWTFAANWP